LIVLGAAHWIVQNLVSVSHAREGIFDSSAQLWRVLMKPVRMKMARQQMISSFNVRQTRASGHVQNLVMILCRIHPRQKSFDITDLVTRLGLFLF